MKKVFAFLSVMMFGFSQFSIANEVMEKKSVLINGLNLSYFESSAVGRPIVLIHGNSNSSKVWQKQFASPLAKKYRLIALDLPGHGESEWDKAAVDDSSVYTLPYMVSSIMTFMKTLKLDRPILIGHSLGGHLVHFLSAYSETSGILTFGAPPLEKASDMAIAFKPVPELGLMFKGELSDGEVETISKLLFFPGEIPEYSIKMIKKSDPQFRANFGLSLAAGLDSREVILLNKLKAPKALLIGAQDSFVNSQYLRELKLINLFKNEVLLFENSGHYPMIDEAERFNDLLNDFSKEAFKKN